MTPPIEAVLLECPGCGAAVLPGDAVEARCTACGALVPLPTRHLEAHQASTQHAELGGRAAELGARIGDAPSPIWRLLTVFEGGCAIYLLLPFILIGGFFISRSWLRALGPLFGRAC